ncbi:MAG: EndoU domain-containing protein, partial [Betaproteobacteria bacterium]|nr:EndoU domain-containing protein [Betaproteobacteria bacterium]
GCGRFISEDPIGLNGGQANLYQYVGGDPIRNRDSSGLIVDTLADIGFIGYDIYTLFRDGNCNLHENLTSLGFNIVGALIPGVTGLGAASRAAKRADKFVDLTTKQRRRHILDGDATGGGHGAGRGIPGKSEFPKGWSDDKVIHVISDIATDPNAVRSAGRGGRTVVEGTREGINVRVILGRDGEIITGFPTNVPRN